MSKRTLPDELRSVLLSHAMQAPDPTDTVHRVRHLLALLSALCLFVVG